MTMRNNNTQEACYVVMCTTMSFFDRVTVFFREVRFDIDIGLILTCDIDICT